MTVPPPPILHARRLGLHSQHEPIVVVREDCPACRSEGLMPRSRVLVKSNGHEIMATLYQSDSRLLAIGEAGLSEAAWRLLGITDGAPLVIRHAPPLASLGTLRSRIYGHRLGAAELSAIIGDMVAGRYSDIELTAFVTAGAALPFDLDETIALTRAMVEAGDTLSWPMRPVMDKHCVGGLPGNRTTPIVVAIVAAHGLAMPKTSSRAITSPAGSADTMETMAPVDLDEAAIRRVIEAEGGCIAWGGAQHLSPADDILIQVERALDIDSPGQLVASVLSKKVAAGATHVVLDLPVGPTAKLRTPADAAVLAETLTRVADAFGLVSRVIFTDGSQPVGRGIGPALEARDVLGVLQRYPDAPADLGAKACALAGALLELGGRAAAGEGTALAAATLADGRAWDKFRRICEAQGGMRVPPVAQLRHALLAGRAGRIGVIDNRRLSRLAKLAGAPEAAAAGIDLHVRLGETVRSGAALMTLHAETPGELRYALDYAAANPDIVGIEDS